MTTVLDRDYFRALRKPEAEAEQEYPAPEHTSRDPWPAGYELPRAVSTIKRHAESHGWTVEQTYSRGHAPHATHGTPLALSHHVSLRMLHPTTRARCVALYSTPVNGGAAKWSMTLIASSSVAPFGGCSITDIKEWLTVAGRVMPGWLDAVRRRNADKAEKTKAAGKKPASKHREGMA